MLRNVWLMRVMGIRPLSVVHIGGHLGQDHNEYSRLGATKIVWGEADPTNVKEIIGKYPDATVIHGLFWSKKNESITFNIMKNRAQNSIYPARINEDCVHTSSMLTTTLDCELKNIELAEPILLTLDVQGAELKVLLGGVNFLEKVDFLICEITDSSSISQFSISESDIFEYLSKYGFKRSIKRYSHSREYYDALYVKGSYLFRIRIQIFDLFRRLTNPFRAIWRSKN